MDIKFYKNYEKKTFLSSGLFFGEVLPFSSGNFSSRKGVRQLEELILIFQSQVSFWF